MAARRFAGWIGLVALVLAGCDNGSTTPSPTPTPTAIPPTASPTDTVPPTATNTPVPTSTPTNSPVPTSTPTATEIPTATSSPTLPPTASPTARQPVPLRVGVSAFRITPCGTNPEWGGPITPSGVWGEEFTDTNGNGRWDLGERFVDDPVSTALDSGMNGARIRYNGIFMAGFGNNRLAKGCLDDIWARAVVIEAGVHKVAMVSIDLIGYLRFGRYYGFDKAQAMVDPALGIDTFVYSSSHSHQGPDALGLWGHQDFSDGKFPRYLQFVDQQVARAITEAGRPENMRPARAVAATTDSTKSPTLRGLQVRTGCRPPWFFDQELRALQFVGDDNATIATVVNWSTHPESLEDENELVSSDFVHNIRERIETALGGTTVYFSGDLGAAEIVGDTCVGNADPHSDDGTNEFDTRSNLGPERTAKIGNLVGDVVVEQLRGQTPVAISALDVATERYRVSGSNELFSFGNTIGVLDLDMSKFAPESCPGAIGLCAPIEQHALTFRDAEGEPLVQMLTAPGELFPEIFFGVEATRRRDCPQAETGQPYEPGMRDAMSGAHRWLIGLSPDHYGYIVPGYDFYAPTGLGTETADVCRGQSYDPNFPGRRSPTHYHESLAIGIDSAVGTACYGLKLVGREAEALNNPACARIFGAR